MFEAFYNSVFFPMTLVIVYGLCGIFIGWTLGFVAGQLTERKEWNNVGRLGRRDDG